MSELLSFVSFIVLSFVQHASCRPSLFDAVRPFYHGNLSGNSSVTTEESGVHWALLIAGSAGYGNYRHQADVAHAYQIMKKGGLKDEHIIVMVTDDLADNFENPHPGQLFNRPGGPDVYAGMKIDYSRSHVNAKNFLAVLAGDESALEESAAGGPVVKSGPNDRVFVYYADHGAPGILGMPWGPFLYADQLMSVLETKANAGGFKEMVIFIEACESGSMFQGLLNDSLPIYATTASNAYESSWGTYCPGMSPPPPPEFTTCLGDLYSVAWMEFVDSADANSVDLQQLYESVKQRTSNNYTYWLGSHVMEFGRLNVSKETLYDWLDEDSSAPASASLWQSVWAAMSGSGVSVHTQEALQGVDARDMQLLYLWNTFARATGAAKEQALEALEAEVQRRRVADRSIRQSVAALLRTSNSLLQLSVAFGVQPSNGAVPDDNGLVEQVVTAAPAGLVEHNAAVVKDWDCLRGMVGAWETGCGRMDDYTMKFTRAFANLCNAGFQPSNYAPVVAASCGQALQGAGVTLVA